MWAISTEKIKQVAKQQNVTLVQYSIINDEVAIAGKKQTQESQLLICQYPPASQVLAQTSAARKAEADRL